MHSRCNTIANPGAALHNGSDPAPDGGGGRREGKWERAGGYDYSGLAGGRLGYPAVAFVAQKLSQAVRVADRGKHAVSGLGPEIFWAGFAAPLVVTISDFRFIVSEQLAVVGIDPGAILIEPSGCNTAPAALHLTARDPQGLMLVAPSDHVIPDAAAFRAAVAQAVPAAQSGLLVTFGITPDRPETGYGYLELAGETVEGVAPLERFVEKPDLVTA